MVCETEPADIDRGIVRVVHFNEIALEQHFRFRQPFVDPDSRRIAERLGRVGETKRGNRQTPFAVGSRPPDRQTGQLWSELHRIDQAPIAVVQTELPSPAVKGKAKVHA